MLVSRSEVCPYWILFLCCSVFTSNSGSPLLEPTAAVMHEFCLPRFSYIFSYNKLIFWTATNLPCLWNSSCDIALGGFGGHWMSGVLVHPIHRLFSPEARQVSSSQNTCPPLPLSKPYFKQLGPNPSFSWSWALKGQIYYGRISSALSAYWSPKKYLAQVTPEVKLSKFLTILIGHPFLLRRQSSLRMRPLCSCHSNSQRMFSIKTFVLPLLCKYVRLHSVTDTPITQLLLDWVVPE